jgi:hypothetical protein
MAIPADPMRLEKLCLGVGAIPRGSSGRRPEIRCFVRELATCFTGGGVMFLHETY